MCGIAGYFGSRMIGCEDLDDTLGLLVPEDVDRVRVAPARGDDGEAVGLLRREH